MIGGFFSGRVVTDDIDTMRVSPYVKAAVGAPAPRPLGETPTFGRFCQQNADQLYFCSADASIRDSALGEVSSANNEPLDPDLPWHRVSLGVNGFNRETGWLWPYDNTPAPLHKWAFGDDWLFWQAGSRIPPAEAAYQATCSDSRTGVGTCLDGVLWYHASTAVGNTSAYSNGQLVGIHGEGLANHYVKITPDRAYMKTYSGTGLMRKFFFLIHTLPDPAPYETILRPRVRPLVAAAEFDVPHVIEDHGGSWDASAMVSYVTADTLQTSGVVWAGAVEPAGIAGNLDPRVQAMALSADGTYVFDTTLLDQGILVSAVELGYPHASADAMGAPSPRTGFTTVLSRLAGGVFVIGGRDLETNAPLGDIHLFRPDVGWSTIPSEVQFGDVKSATFAPSDGSLWILEQRTSSYSIVRVNPWTGQATSLGIWPRGDDWDQHFLAVDRDGAVILVASSQAYQRSKVGRLRVDAGGAAYASFVDDEGVVPYTTSGPIVDSDEYGFIVRDGTGAVTSIFRRANLVRSTAITTLDHFFE